VPSCANATTMFTVNARHKQSNSVTFASSAHNWWNPVSDSRADSRDACTLLRRTRNEVSFLGMATQLRMRNNETPTRQRLDVHDPFIGHGNRSKNNDSFVLADPTVYKLRSFHAFLSLVTTNQPHDNDSMFTTHSLSMGIAARTRIRSCWLIPPSTNYVVSIQSNHS
jgi:hypothetical protein